MAHVIRLTRDSQENLTDYIALTDVELRKSMESQAGLYIAESFKVIKRALDAGHQPRSVLLQEQWLDEVDEIFEDFDCPIYVADSSLIEQISGFNVHRGALASMHRPQLPTVEKVLEDATLVIVLEDIVDHTNVGAIFRAAAGMGADAVLVSPRCADPLYRRSVRVSMGAVLQVPWTRIPIWNQTQELLHSQGFHIAALALSDMSISLREFASNPPEKIALVLGTEGDGLSAGALSIADSIVKIPMAAGVDSLNVAAASAVALYALTKQ